MGHHLGDLARLPLSQLDRTFRGGERPDFLQLDGFLFRGGNLTFPGSLFVPRFAKGFFTENGRRMGYNVPVERGPLDAPWYTKPREGPRRFGFYAVEEPCFDLRLGNGLLLDYGKGGNRGPARFLRAVLVQVERDSQDLFLGHCWLALGKWVALGYFALERWGKAPERPPR
jgi:hypothetical protein